MNMKRPYPLKAIFDIRRDELPFALLMFAYFFLVITSFWILKPIKKGLFIEFYDQTGMDLFQWHLSGPQAELLAKVLNMAVAIGAVILFTWLARRFRRQQLTAIFTAVFILSYLVYMPFIRQPGELTVWTFYLFGDLFASLMVATFFAFLNDSVTATAAKRLYGLVGLGGVSGGVFGSTTVRAFIDRLDAAAWLWILTGLGMLITTIAFAAGRKVLYRPSEPLYADRKGGDGGSGNPALEGARLALRSPYLLSIVAIVGLYEIVSTVMDFQFTATVAHYLDGPAIGKQFSTVFAITNGVSMTVQLFFTGFVMSRLGVMAALLVLPLAALGGSAVFMALPVLWPGSLLSILDNGFNYSINQSAKESLYVPTTTEEKYKAKAFIDMFVYRLAKALAVLISLGVTTLFSEFSSIRWLTLFTIPVFALWIYAAQYAGRKFMLNQ